MWTRCTHWSCQHFFFHEVRPLLTRSCWTAPYSHHPPEVNALYPHALFPGHVTLFLQSFFFSTNELAFAKDSLGALVAHVKWTRRTVQSPPTWGRAAQTWSQEGLAEFPARFALGPPRVTLFYFTMKSLFPLRPYSHCPPNVDTLHTLALS